MGEGGPIWVQEELVSQGLARVYSFPDNRSCIAELLARENEARAKRLGVWGSPAYRVQSTDDLDRLGRLTQSYDRKEIPAFAAAGIDLKVLAGKKVGCVAGSSGARDR
jgi:hypothetical protein